MNVQNKLVEAGGGGTGPTGEENTFKGKISKIFGLSSRQAEPTTPPSGVDGGDKLEKRPPQLIHLTLEQLRGEGERYSAR